jgi:hypothetical protein
MIPFKRAFTSINASILSAQNSAKIDSRFHYTVTCHETFLLLVGELSAWRSQSITMEIFPDARGFYGANFQTIWPILRNSFTCHETYSWSPLSSIHTLACSGERHRSASNRCHSLYFSLHQTRKIIFSLFTLCSSVASPVENLTAIHFFPNPKRQNFIRIESN